MWIYSFKLRVYSTANNCNAAITFTPGKKCRIVMTWEIIYTSVASYVNVFLDNPMILVS